MSDDTISRQGMCDSLNKYRIEKMSEGKDVSLVWECIDKVLQEPSAQPNVHDVSDDADYISRETMKDAIDNTTWYHQNRNGVMVEGASDEETAWFKAKDVFKAIENVPSAQPDRRYDEWCTDCKEYDQEKHCCPRWNRVIRTTLQDAQRTGRWIEDSGNIACSECHIIWLHRRTAFCPNCGADMRGEQDE